MEYLKVEKDLNDLTEFISLIDILEGLNSFAEQKSSILLEKKEFESLKTHTQSLIRKEQEIKSERFLHLEEMNFNLNSILSDFHLGIMTLDSHMSIQWANENMTNIFGFKPEEIVGQNWYDVLPPMQERKLIYQKVLEGEALDFPEIEEKCGDDISYFDVHYRPVKNKEGKIKGILAIGNQITNKINTAASPNYLSNDFFLSSDAINDPYLSLIVTNPEGFIERVNETACKMYGKSEKEFLNDHIVNIYAQKELKTLKEFSAKVNEEGYVGYNSFHKKSDGSEFPVHINMTSVKTIDGKPLYSIAGIFDISDRSSYNI